MAAEVKSFQHHNSHSKNPSLITSKVQNMPSARGEELVKEVFRKRTIDHKGNSTSVIESNKVNDSNKSKKKSNNICGQNQNQQKKNQGGNELSLNVVRKGTEKLSIKENKCIKPSPHSKVCYCAPTTHEGSFRCRLHRKKKKSSSTTENNKKKSNLRLNSHFQIVDQFQPQMLPRFGRVSCAQDRTQQSNYCELAANSSSRERFNFLVAEAGRFNLHITSS